MFGIRIYPLLFLFAATAGAMCTLRDTQEESAAIEPVRLCYKNEYPFAGGEEMDVLELRLEIHGDSIYGTYHWLPAYKDQRRGIVKGIRKDALIAVSNFYTQEGIKDSAELILTLKDSSVVIEGRSREAGLAATIAQVACRE